MVSIPEFIELVSKKVDCATDLTILKKKRESIKAEYTKYYNNLMVNEKRLAELDTSDKHYDRRVDSLNRVMDDLLMIPKVGWMNLIMRLPWQRNPP